MKFLKGFFTFILTIILFLATTSLLFLLPLRNAVNKNEIKETITNVDFETLLKENPQVEEDINEAFKPLYDTANQFGIDKEVVNKIINSREVKGLIGDFAGNLVDYILTGKDQKIISDEEIENLVGNAIDDINNSGYYKFKEEEKQKILDAVKEKVNEFQDFIPDTNIFDETINSNEEGKVIIDYARFILSDKLIVYLVFIEIIAIFGILALKLKEGKWIKHISITVLTSSTLMAIGTLLLLNLGNLISDEVSLVTNIIQKSLNYGLTLSIIVSAIMIVILILYVIIHKSISKKPKEITE